MSIVTKESSNFVRSEYEILKLFDTETPKTVEEIYRKLAESKIEISLGATTTIVGRIYSFSVARCLTEKDTGYVLTLNGVRELSRLKRLIQGTDS